LLSEEKKKQGNRGVESEWVPEKLSCGGQFRARVYEDRRVKSIMCGSKVEEGENGAMEEMI